MSDNNNMNTTPAQSREDSGFEINLVLQLEKTNQQPDDVHLLNCPRVVH